jgi:hypothetical protein
MLVLLTQATCICNDKETRKAINWYHLCTLQGHVRCHPHLHSDLHQIGLTTWQNNTLVRPFLLPLLASAGLVHPLYIMLDLQIDLVYAVLMHKIQRLKIHAR